MKNVIISGADGFVGSYTVEYFLARGITVLALDRNEKPRRLKENSGLTYMQCDVSDTSTLFNLVDHDKYDTFVHFAWAGSAGIERTDYNLQMQNALNTVECMKIAKQLGCKKFVCAGSIMEYEVEAVIHAQGSQPGMAYIYGMGKHIAHCLCKAVAVNIGIELIWPLITNAYGVGEFSPRFVNTTLRKILHNEPLQFTSGTQNYDFVYITDVARAFYLIAENGKPNCEYLIGSGNAKQLREFIIEMQQACAPGIVPQFGDVPFTGINMPLSTFDTKLTESDTGFKPEISFGEGTKMTLDWLKEIEQ